MRSQKIRKIVTISMLSAIAYILMFFAFPVIPAFGFLKADLSDVVVLIGTFIYGPIGGIAVAVLRSLLHFITFGASLPDLIGDGAGVLASISFLVPMYYLLHKINGVPRQIFAATTATIILAAVMGFMNLTVITPLYIHLLGMNLGMSITKYVLLAVVPFNLVKGILLSVAFGLVYVKMMPWVKAQASSLHH